MEASYDPERVRALAERTLDAIAAFDTVRSTDPAAAGAMRAARLARRNLEDLWMPAIREIERSDAMVSPIGADPNAPDGWRRPPRPHRAPLRDLTDDELLDLVDVIDRLLADEPPGGERIDTYGVDTLPAKYDLTVLAAELADRVRADPAFRRRLLEHAPRTVVIGRLVGRARFPVGFVADLVVALTGPMSARGSLHPTEYGRSLGEALDVLADHPAVALRVLLDDAVLRHLATTRHVDTRSLATFANSALTLAATHRPADGYRVLTRLTGTDHLNAGFSLGLAGSLDTFLDTLAPAIARRDQHVVIAGVAGDPDIGSYSEVRSIFGEILRHPDAAVALGASLGNYTDRVVDRLGDDLGADGTLTTLAQLVAMIDEAATTEQAQLTIEAGVAEASRRRVGAAVGAGATIVLTATGVGAAARGLVAGFIGLGTDVLARIEPERLAGASIGGRLHHQISTSALRAALTRPEILSGSTGRDHTDDEVAEFRRRLDEIEDCDRQDACRPGDAADALSVLEQDMGDDSRAIRFLDRLRTGSGLDSLR